MQRSTSLRTQPRFALASPSVEPLIRAKAMLAAATRAPRAFTPARAFARLASTSSHKFVVVGGGTAGVTVAAQLRRAFAAEKRPLNEGDIAIIEPASEHHCASRASVPTAVPERGERQWRDCSPSARHTLTGDCCATQTSQDGPSCAFTAS